MTPTGNLPFMIIVLRTKRSPYRFKIDVPAPRCPRVLLPIILLFCVIGSYAIGGSYFDVGVMLSMGLLGLVLERHQVPLGPVVLGIILGGPLEERFLQTLTSSRGAVSAFFDRPMAAGLGATCILLWLAPLLVSLARRRG